MTPDDFSSLRGSHDLRLSAWGPYSKRYMGISHIPDVKAGLRFDLSVFPGLYRRSVNIPNVLWDTGYHPWEASPDLSYYSHRHEIIWKDQVYADIAFCRLDDEAVLIRALCVNNTDAPESVVLHYMAYLNFPPKQTNNPEALRPCRVHLPPGGLWIDGMAYESVTYTRFDPAATLVYDGHLRGEVRDHGFTGGTGLGQGFGQDAGDSVTYALDAPGLADAGLVLRCRAVGDNRLMISGVVDAEFDIRGQSDFIVYSLPVGRVEAGRASLTLTCAGGAPLEIDGLALVNVADADAVRFESVVWNPAPDRLDSPRPDTLLLRYDHDMPVYGLAWGAAPFEVRSIICDDLDTWVRYMVHDHVHDELRGPGDGHFTNIFMRPIFLEPGEQRTIYGLVCTGTEEAVARRLADFDPHAARWLEIDRAGRARAADLTPNPAGETYRFSQERMAATVLSNVVYPVRTRGTWIRHYPPGRWWDSLYTWDSGFVGLGLLELDAERAIDNLNAYVTEPGTPDAAFIHHGSPVPTQFPLFLELWNRTQARALLDYFYPRLQQYHRFLAGRLGSSTTRTLRSNLLRTWDYFYNSGGWDDYPPQVHVHAHSLESVVTPVVNTAHVVRAAKILRMAALALGEDTAEYDTDITLFTNALQQHAWDEQAGYFSYVTHDTAGRPDGFLRHASGANFNMGLDGASPLVAGICTLEQEARLTGYLMDVRRLWSRCGLSTVDQSSPYYREDGYWNGAVWMSHQWYFWKTLLDMGRADEAHRIAVTALDVWKNEVERSYNCYEHFIVKTGRGAGWHHFGGLSTPVLSWYGAYHRPGRLTTGFDMWVEAAQVDDTGARAALHLHSRAHHSPVVIVTLKAAARYAVRWNGALVSYNERYPGTLEIHLPGGVETGVLEIRAG